jgi:AcrR family transcriptional regulator
MKPSHRALRDRMDAIPGNQPRFNAREQDRQEHIVNTGRTVLAEFGTGSFTMTAFALAMRMSAATIRRHFIDLDSLLIHILNRHLLTLSTVMGTLPRGANDKHAARRAAYLAHTRTPLGGLTEAHLLLVRDRHLLPLDDLERIEQIRANLATMMSGEHASAVIELLDMPTMGLADIDAILAARAAHAAAPAQPLPVTPRPIFKLPRPQTDQAPWPARWQGSASATEARAGP